MESLLLEIVEILRAGRTLDTRELGILINQHNARAVQRERQFSKKKLLPFYLRVKEEEPKRWQSWNIDDALEQRLFATLRMKPRRTASGVATITVITKPWSCSSDCLYCPNDLRMPKSYLHAEPACQRAERNFFDPYLQVMSRLRALVQMGHPCDKVELIVLGGSWTDYSKSYQVWFIRELFRALNDGQAGQAQVSTRRSLYEDTGISGDEGDLAAYVHEAQHDLMLGNRRFNDEVKRLYGADSCWRHVSAWQSATFDDLVVEHERNENAQHRVVGLVIETRPDAIAAESLRMIRMLGCTKVQIGVQSLRQDILELNERHIEVAQIQHAFELLRIFGFKIHSHFMVNLYGATPDDDRVDYCKFMSDRGFMPDEVKLYPCALIDGTRLVDLYERKQWQPYDEDTLVDVLVDDVIATPAFCRVSRMIRDFSAGDIVAGNKKTNLRQMVERKLDEIKADVREIRYREISVEGARLEQLHLEDVSYETSATHEHFLQWVTETGDIAGFLRLSLPKQDYLHKCEDELPVSCGEAMIREVHVYGAAARIEHVDSGVQHQGLGRSLVDRACALASDAGYSKINVISSVGTRGYYRKLGFADNGLYQQKEL